MSILLKEQRWVFPAGVGQDGEWHEEMREHTHNLRDFNPEINHWGDLAIGVAFGSYSQEEMEHSKNAKKFLDYIDDQMDKAAIGYIRRAKTKQPENA